MELQQWLAQWLEVWCHGKKPSTLAGYTGLAANHIAPALGCRPLEQITPEDVQRLVNAIHATTPRTAQLVFDVLHTSLDRAVRSGHLAANPAALADRPRHLAKEGYALTPEEEAALVQVGQSSPLWPAFALMLRAGLRRGEVIALRWGDINLIERWIEIRRTATPIHGQLVIDTPKSRAGIRSIPICDSLHALLSDHRLDALAHGRASRERPVIVSRHGTMTTADSLRYACNKLCMEAVIPAIRLHDLRHTFATRAFQKGMNAKTLQSVLGHATIALTLNLYSHAQRDHIHTDFLQAFGGS